MVRLRPSKRVSTAIVVGAVTLAIIGYVMRPAVLDVDAGAATRGPLRVTVDEDGKTRVRDRFVIAAPVTGRLRRLTLREGALINPGQVVAWLAPLPLDEPERHQLLARLAAAEALAAEATARAGQARAAAAQARRTLDRRDALLAAGAISPESREAAALDSRSRNAELTAADARARAATADVEAARAALLAVGATQATAIPIRSPAHGRVLRIPDMSERVTTAGTPILELGDASSLEVVVDVLSTDAVRLCAGQAVELAEWGGERPLRGRVRSIEPAAFTRVSALGVDEQRVNVIIDLLDGAATLGDGFRVEVRVIVWEGPNVLQVPASALVQNANGSWSAFVIEGGRARQRRLVVGHQTSDATEILSGVSPGTVVILFPSDQIKDGVRVRRRSP